MTKGYNDTSGEAFQKASDLAFETVKLGQTSFPELASSIGKVIPLASALGVEQEELFGSFAALTGVTGSTAEVSTQMKAVMSGLMQPTQQMTDALNALGYANADAALESLGFNGLLQSLKSTMGDDVQATAKLFSSVEAQTAILALAGAQSEDLTNKTATDLTTGSILRPMLVRKFFPRFLITWIVYSSVSVCASNAFSVAFWASYIASVLFVRSSDV